MKRNLIFALLIAAFAFVQASAQPTPTTETRANRREKMANSTPEQRAQRQTEQMKKQLDLSAQQETAVASINLKYAQQAQTLMDAAERSRESIKQVRTMMTSKDEELKKVFSEEQYKQYDAFKDARKGQAKRNRGQRAKR
ncbi:hypothetical protein [Spirosoma utsteinense]|uniref:DUF4890 domain-containing protein n=1 Tax=Spirosoma utsteinense TaxID=2585773 RepID=A0ABR6WE28_9BACT|nr:hypothetical protein [Spirosoma utsteinense]MBC3788863.1 hypothetical protein [Spirosoma utsteinense]MBC3794804.1 hypothetical protein [Spirosoma utsteinense]